MSIRPMRGGSCRSVARQIDGWLDARCPVALPDAAAEHLRVCEDCRRRVTEWNAVELRLRALRDEWPRTGSAASFTTAALHRDAMLGSRRANGRLALGLACGFLVLAALTAGVVYMQSEGQRARTLASTHRPDATSLGERALDAFRRDLPVAHTR